MSLESKIEALTVAVNNLTTVLQSTTVSVPVAPVAVPSVPVAAVPSVPVPFAPPALEPNAIIPSVAPAMPAPPSFMTPVPSVPVPFAGAPFSDDKGLIAYVMSKYKALGPEKGALIQNVLTSLGYQNINEIKPEHYGALYQGVEALGA